MCSSLGLLFGHIYPIRYESLLSNVVGEHQLVLPLLSYSGCRQYDYSFGSPQYLHCGTRQLSVVSKLIHYLQLKNVKRLKGTNCTVSEGTIGHDPEKLAVLTNLTSVSKELYKQHSHFGI